MPDRAIEPEVTLDHVSASFDTGDPTVDPTSVSRLTETTSPLAPAQGTRLPDVPGYAITGEIAKGGMGRVYAGRDLTLEREVAIKTLLSGANADRFVVEAKITARLPHPGIPPVHALGTLADGTPFLAMKLVRGRTLAEELKLRPSPLHDLSRFVQVFEQICHAVGFAHSQRIIHRDLKPANVMVGAFGEVQVMDWGLAKEGNERTQPKEPREDHGESEFDTTSQAEARTPSESEFTRAGAILGTPGYMAPEQARGEIVGPSSDVFALGGILCSILTGKAVFSGATAVETIQRAAVGDTSSAVARLRSSGADAELVSITQRCLQVVAADRPADGQAVAALVAAYRRGVEDRLKQAETERAEALVREAERLKRRKIWLALAATLVVGIIASGILAYTANVARQEAESARSAEARLAREEKKAKDDAERAWGKEKEQRAIAEGAEKTATAERDKAQREKANAVAVRDFLRNNLIRQASVWAQATRTGAAPGNSNAVRHDVTVRELLDQAAVEFAPDKIDVKFPGQVDAQAEILETIGEAYESTGEYAKSVAFVKAAAELRTKHYGFNHPATLASELNLALAYIAASRFGDASTCSINIVRKLDQLLAEHSPGTPGDPAALAFDAVLAAMERRVDLRYFHLPAVKLGVTEGALLVLQAGLALPATRSLAERVEARFGPQDRRTLFSQMILGFALHALGQVEQATEYYERVQEQARGQLDEDDFLLIGLNEVLSVSYEALKRDPAEIRALTERIYQTKLRILGPDHPATVSSLGHLASSYDEAREWPKAIELQEQVHASYVKLFGVDDPETLARLADLGWSCQKAGQVERAIKLFEQIHVMRTKKQGSDHEDTLVALGDLADACKVDNQLPRAVDLYQQMYDALAKKLGKRHVDTLKALHNLAKAHQDAKQLPQAIQLFTELRDGRAQTLGADNKSTIDATSHLAAAYRDAKDWKRSVPLWEQVRDWDLKNQGPENLDTLTTLHSLGRAYHANGQYEEAINVLEQARSGRLNKLGPEDKDTISTLHYLAWSYQLAKKFPQAFPLFQQVYETRVKTQGPDHQDTLNTLGNLGTAYCDAGMGAEASVTLRSFISQVRHRYTSQPASMSNMLAAVATDLLRCQEYVTAEEMLRESLALRQEVAPDAWTTFQTQAMVGGTLLKQKKYAEAEPMLLAGYEGLKARLTKIPPTAIARVSEVADMLVELYSVQEKPDEVKKWQMEREMYPAKS